MSLSHLGLIGAGSIAAELTGVLARRLDAPLDRMTVLTRPGRAETAMALEPAAAHVIEVVETVDDLIAAAPGLVLECAGHGAVRAHVPALLCAGIDTVAASTGALADPVLAARLTRAAHDGGALLTLPAGAVGGMDILAGLRHADIATVTYVSRKPPGAWKGTPAEAALDLDALTEAATFYDGTAREAARDYPKNANVAATIALSGIGFDKTRVRLVADPGVTANVHAFDVTSDAADVTVRIEGKPSPRNPKTSMPTVYSLVREVMRRVDPVVI